MTDVKALPPDTVTTRIWQEIPEDANPHAVKQAFCHGYDVFGAMVGQARWVEMVYLLLKGEVPNAWQVDLLEALAVGLANPGPRDPSVHAAMCGGIAGSNAAASLMAALAVGAGGEGGAREVFRMMEQWLATTALPASAEEWLSDAAKILAHRAEPGEIEIWPLMDHPPGLGGHPGGTPATVRKFLQVLAAASGTPRLSWLELHRERLEALSGRPLTISGVAATAFADLGLTAAEGEMLFLLFRLPGAMAHALEQRTHGYVRFPFGPIEAVDSLEESV